VVANSKLPAADEARSDLALATLGMGAKAAGVVPDALRSIEAASTADDLKVMTVASRAFHLPDEIIVRGQPVRESVPASDPARRDLLDVQMQTRAAITGFPTSADAGQSSLHDQESGMDHDRQHQRNAIKTRAVSEAVSQLQPSAIDVLTPATATVRDVGIAQQITSAVHTVLGESLGGGGTPSAMHADTTSFYQPALRVLDLILQPEELGRVSIKMRLSADGLSVTLEAEKNSTVRLLQQEANGLTDRLIADGYDLEALSVQLFSLGSIGAKEASGSASLNSQHRFDSSGNPDSGKGGPGGQGDQHFRNLGSGREDSGGAEPDAADVAPDVRKHVYV
jgi:flagellar hook-length control protein FliK